MLFQLILTTHKIEALDNNNFQLYRSLIELPKQNIITHLSLIHYSYLSLIHYSLLLMLIQLEIESLIKQIQASNSLHHTYKSLQNLSTTSSQIDSDDDNKSTGSLFQRTKSQFSSSHQVLKDFSKKTDKQLNKISHISQDTFMSDKLVRLVGSVLKVVRVFKLIKNIKKLQRLSQQIMQLRRLLRYNRFLSYAREIKPLLTKPNKKWLDYYNIVFKNLQLFVDINDTISYFQQIKLISKETFDGQLLRKNVSNCYFIECLMFLYLNLFDYIKNREHRSSQQNLKKELTIAKYALDSFTSHNEFSRKLFSCDPKLNTLVGFISSIVGLIVLWV